MIAIFDLDGTLVDSSNAIANAINYVRDKLNLPSLPKEEIIYHINNPDTNLAKYLYNVNKTKPIYEEWFKEYYTKYHNKELVLFDGIKDMLIDLKNSNIKLAVATNGYKDSTLKALNHLNITKYFDAIVSFEDVKSPKPAPDMLIKIIKDFNIDTTKAIFIGDSKRDYLASKNANIKFIEVDFINNKITPQKIAKEIKSYFNLKN